MRARRLGLGACALVLWGCDGLSTAPAPLGPPCEAAAIREDMDRIEPDDLTIVFEAPSSPQLDRVAADLGHYLAELWGTDGLAILRSPPSSPTPYTLWLSTSAEARAAAATTIVEGYALRRSHAGGAQRLVAYGTSEQDLAYAAYALLEELGVRFFHPKQELVPRLGGVYWPVELAVERRPAFATRGLQLHLLHPTEYFKPFNEPGEQNLRDAEQLVDWLVKTGQNHLQWSILSTVDLEAWKPHARAIIDYAHARGVTVGAVVILWGEASLQNAYDLVTAEVGWQAELETQLDYLLDLDWDVVEIGLGEFFAGDPAEILAWLDHATEYVATEHPATRLSVTNHVGNYPELWIDFEGETLFYYHLPGRADPRLINDVHTVFFFDLFRSWGGYGHDDFHLQQEFLWEQLPARAMRYMPESAYWCSSDIDVPIFLPEYIHARWLDIQNIVAETERRGLPRLDGHVLFSSGHEWGYWLTDYLTAKVIWEPEQDLGHFLRHYTSAYGSCAAQAERALGELVALQTEYLFDRRLVPYLSTEDLHDDMGYLLGITTHPPRVPFAALGSMAADELSSFEEQVLGGLDAFGAAMARLEDDVASVCARADETLAPWCAELRDGIAVTRLRAAHAVRLYRALLAQRRGTGDSAAWLAQARELTARAAAIVAGREPHYRFDLETLVGAYPNPTRYPFGYLRQAHTQCLWHRQEEQAALVLETGVTPAGGALPTCQD